MNLQCPSHSIVHTLVSLTICLSGTAFAQPSTTARYGQDAYQRDLAAGKGLTRIPLGDSGYTFFAVGLGQRWYLHVLNVCVAKQWNDCTDKKRLLRLLARPYADGGVVGPRAVGRVNGVLSTPWRIGRPNPARGLHRYPVGGCDSPAEGCIWLSRGSKSNSVAFVQPGIEAIVRITGWTAIPCPSVPGRSCDSHETVIGDIQFVVSWTGSSATSSARPEAVPQRKRQPASSTARKDACVARCRSRCGVRTGMNPFNREGEQAFKCARNCDAQCQ